jgi:TIR domain
MSDIFISYDDQDRPRVRPLVEALEARGWSVWWDHRISTGEAFALVIERELESACCVVVVWTNTSVHSDWVRAEADEAWKHRKLVPVFLDRAKPPMPFGQIQAADLVDWHEQGHQGFARLIADLHERIGKAPVHIEKATRAERAAGHWQAHVTYPDGASFEDRFTFEITGRELSGTASMRGYGYRRGILDGTIDGDRLSFRTTGRVQFNLSGVRDVTYLYRGTLERDAIRFTVEEEGRGDPAVAFTASRISAEQANRIATGGTRPRLSGMDTSNLYRPDRVREVVSGRQGAIDACYRAAEFDKMNHEFVDFHLTLSADGAPEQFEMRPRVAALESCMRTVLSAIEWGPTDTGKGGTVRLSITARLPWNP